MAEQIWRYELGFNETVLEVPLGSIICHIGLKNDDSLHVWLAVDTTQKETKKFYFKVVPTGCDLPEGHYGAYQATFITKKDLVFHVFFGRYVNEKVN